MVRKLAPLLLLALLGLCALSSAPLARPPIDDDGRVVVTTGGTLPPGPTRTEWGGRDGEGSASASISDVALEAGDLLVVFTVAIAADGPPGGCSVLWNGNGVNSVQSVSATLSCASFDVAILVAPSTATADVNFSQGGADNVMGVAVSWRGMTATPFDRGQPAEGASAAPSCTDDGATAQANEILEACVFQPDQASPVRTWGNGITNGLLLTSSQPAATLCSPLMGGGLLTEGYKQLGAVGVQTASKSGGAATSWAILEVMFKF